MDNPETARAFIRKLIYSLSSPQKKNVLNRLRRWLSPYLIRVLNVDDLLRFRYCPCYPDAERYLDFFFLRLVNSFTQFCTHKSTKYNYIFANVCRSTYLRKFSLSPRETRTASLSPENKTEYVFNARRARMAFLKRMFLHYIQRTMISFVRGKSYSIHSIVK